MGKNEATREHVQKIHCKLAADFFFFFFFFYERDFMKPLSRENQADIIEAFNSTPRYLDDLLNIKKNCGKD